MTYLQMLKGAETLLDADRLMFFPVKLQKKEYKTGFKLFTVYVKVDSDEGRQWNKP